MARVQKILEERMAEAQAKRAQLDQRLKALGEKQKALDLRRRARAEKILLRTLLEQVVDKPDLGSALTAIIRSAGLKDEERDLALWLLNPRDGGAATGAANAA